MLASLSICLFLASSQATAPQLPNIERPREVLSWKGAGYVVTGKPATSAQLKLYEPIFNKEWALYPPSYVQKAKLDRIVFVADLSVDGQARAAVPAFDGNTMYYDPALGSYNPHYQRLVVHHEFFHMVDQRMQLLYKDAEWSKLNPAGFRYGSGGALMRTSGVGELTTKIPGFVTPYATAALEEDKAELFSHMVIDGAFVRDLARKDKVVAAKIALLKQRLAKFDPGMGEAFWKKVGSTP
jgi:hypothetical protein